jgi:hypothetical protein
MNIITRKQALEQGLAHYFTGKPCKHGHVAERTTSHRNCLQCVRAIAPRMVAGEPWKQVAKRCCSQGLSFVYAYLRADGSPYYVGVASRALRPTQVHKVGCIDLAQKDESRIVVLRAFLTRQQALLWESFYIAKYGRVADGGKLRNTSLVAGGIGPGYVWPKEVVAARGRTRVEKICAVYELSLEAWEGLTRGQRNVVRKRWLNGARGDALLINPPKVTGSQKQIAAARRRTQKAAIKMGIDPVKYRELSQADRSRVRMRYRADWPSERLLEPARMAA